MKIPVSPCRHLYLELSDFAALAAEAEGAVREPLSLCGEVGDFGEPE